jgi:hypothetical protein
MMRNKLFVIAIGLVSLIAACKKKDAETPTKVTPSPTTPFFVKFTVTTPSASFATTDYSFTPSLAYCTGLYYGPFNSGGTFRSYNSIFKTFNNTTSPVLTIFKNDSILRTFTSFNDSVFIALNTPKYYNYISNPSLGTANSYGIRIEFIDSNNVLWSTLKQTPGLTFQPSTSLFQITDADSFSQYAPSQASRTSVKYKANFACKLFNNAGDSIYITNGNVIALNTKM